MTSKRLLVDLRAAIIAEVAPAGLVSCRFGSTKSQRGFVPEVQKLAPNRPREPTL
jgi:hypothetical protein